MSPSGQKNNGFMWLFVSLSRGLAAFMALYSLLSLGTAVFVEAYNQNAWWIDFSFLPDELSALEQAALTLALGFFAVHVPRHIVTRVVVGLPVFLCLLTATINAISVYELAAEDTIVLGFPLPFSVFVGIGVLCILISILLGGTYLADSPRRRRGRTTLVMAASFVLSALLFPLGQMHCFGTTDYRVPVDAAVVFGAQVLPDGTPSKVLQDRLDTAIRFYEDGYTPVLVMSGGIDVGGISEAHAMRDYAVESGVPAEDIIIDEQGSTTQLTARNTVAELRDAGLSKVAAVSNFYHLARIKMLYLAEGMDVVTVPSTPVKDARYPLMNVVREIPGWWYYWILNLVE